MYNTTKFTTILTMMVACILCSCSNTVATERITRITFYSSSDQVTQAPQPSPNDVTSSVTPKNAQRSVPVVITALAVIGAVAITIFLPILILPTFVVGIIIFVICN